MEPDLIGQEKGKVIAYYAIVGLPQWSLTSSVRKSPSDPHRPGRRRSRNGA